MIVHGKTWPITVLSERICALARGNQSLLELELARSKGNSVRKPHNPSHVKHVVSKILTRLEKCKQGSVERARGNPQEAGNNLT